MTEETAKGFMCTIFAGGNRPPKLMEIQNIYKDDAEYFDRIGAKTSMEPAAGQYALYADVGLKQDDRETPREILVLSGAMNCQDAFRKLRAECEKALAAEVV